MTSHRTSSALESGPPNGPTPVPTTLPPPRWRGWLLPIGLSLTLILLLHSTSSKSISSNVRHSAVVQPVRTDKLTSATISSTGALSGKFTSNLANTPPPPTALNDDTLAATLVTLRVTVAGSNPDGVAATP